MFCYNGNRASLANDSLGIMKNARFSVGSERASCGGCMAELWGKTISREDILRRVGDIRQLAHVEPFELVDGPERGTRGVRMTNGAGLELVVAADRGMAITDLRFRGVPLPFASAIGTIHPAYGDPHGKGWLRSWPGGFLTLCGLNQVGSPSSEPENGVEGESLGLHGRLAGLPARAVRWGSEWQGDQYALWVDGTVRQAAMFGENLSLHRRVGTVLDDARFWIEDTVENHAFVPAEHMFLQHFNLGFPLVDDSTRLELPPHTTTPRDDEARVGLEHYDQYEAPQPGYREQVFYHDLRAGPDGMAAVRLTNPAFDHGKGLSVTWRYALADYPFLVQWKMMGEGLYVAGIEPANCHVEGRAVERERGTLQVLRPLERRTYRIDVMFA
jgi:hypothetical protein